MRSLEFKYTNLPRIITEAGAGGTVEFLRLVGGSWLVNRWRVRLPVFGLPEHVSERSGRFSVNVTTSAIGAIQVTGGEVTRVARNDVTQYQAVGPVLTLQVVSRDPLLPAAGAMLAVAGTDYVATADSTGRIALSPVLEGHYRVRVQSWLMDSLGMAAVERDVDVGAGAHVDSLALPTAREALAKLCPADAVRHGEGMLRGRVRDERGRPVKQAAVTVPWQGGFANTGNGITAHEETLGVLTDDEGGWRVCGVPRGTAVAARVVTDSGADSRTATLAEDQAFRGVDLVTHHDASASTAISGSRALVEFAVYGNGGAPLPGATLDVTVPSGATRTVITGPGGRALMPDVTPGLLRVRAKRIGLKPGQLAVTVEAGRNTVPILLSDATMPALDTVRIVGNKITNGRLDEFETRRLRHEATASFTHEDKVKRNVVDAWQMLSGVSAVHFIPSGANGGLLLVSSRGMNVNASGALPCFIGVMIDGMVMQGEIDGNFDMSHLPPPDQIAGMELFAGPAEIPAKYGGSLPESIDKRCGFAGDLDSLKGRSPEETKSGGRHFCRPPSNTYCRLLLRPATTLRHRGNVVRERFLVAVVREERGEVAVARLVDLLHLIGTIRSLTIDATAIGLCLRDDIDRLRLDRVGDRDALEHRVDGLRITGRHLLWRHYDLPPPWALAEPAITRKHRPLPQEASSLYFLQRPPVIETASCRRRETCRVI